MAINLTCRCGKKLVVRDDLAGRKGKCPACGMVLEIPAFPGARPLAAAASSFQTSQPKPAQSSAKSSSRIIFPSSEPPAAGAAAEKGSGKSCPQCQTPVKSQEIFCVKCGASLETRAPSRLTRRTGDSSVSLPRLPKENLWKRRGITALAVALPILALLLWHGARESAAARQWREATQDGASIPRPEVLDRLMNMDPREQLRICRFRIDGDIARMSHLSFESRREGYEDFYHLVDLSSVPGHYRPDLGWWSRRKAISQIEDWWEESRSGLYWDPVKCRFGAKRRSVQIVSVAPAVPIEE